MGSVRVVSFFKNQGVKLPSLWSTIHKPERERIIRRVRDGEMVPGDRHAPRRLPPNIAHVILVSHSTEVHGSLLAFTVGATS